jgi:hypothetical protein
MSAMSVATGGKDPLVKLVTLVISIVVTVDDVVVTVVPNK